MSKTISAKTAASQNWPSLRVEEWTASRDTLHMWTQIVGKIRLAHAPMVKHWWQVTLYVSPRGLTTSAIPYEAGVFDIESTSLSTGCTSDPVTEPRVRSPSDPSRSPISMPKQ